MTTEKRISLCFFSFLSLIFTNLNFARAGSILDRLDSFSKNKGPGFAYLISINGNLVRSEGWGDADLLQKTPIETKTLFNLASNSKQFTAMALLILESQGKINLQDSVRTYIPELPLYAKDIQVRHLLYHTSGLKDYIPICQGSSQKTNSDVLAFLSSETRLDFKPGTRREYSNTGYVILAEVIQRVARMPFPEFIQKNIFERLGMTDSWIIHAGTDGKIPNIAQGYGEWPFFELQSKSNCDYVHGDGGIYTHLEDYQKWMVAIEKPVLVPENFQKKLFTPGQLDNGRSLPYGYGWSLQELGGMKMVVHTGAWVGYRSFSAYVPERKTWVVLFSNSASVPSDAIVDALLEKYLNPGTALESQK